MTPPRDCYRHPGAAGTNVCGVCLKPICDACLTWANLEPACPVCARKKRDRSGARQVLVVGAVVFLGCTGMATAMFLYEKPFDYGEHSGTIIVLKQELDRTPCDREAIVKLGETMSRAGDYRGALESANGWLDRCGEYERLRWVTYAAHRDLRNEPAAIREATKLIELDPDDKDYWWWRAILYERSGELRKAAADYEKALEIQPRLTGIPFNLADVYERLGKPCDALRPLEQFREHHPESDDARTTHRMSRLREACGGDVSTTTVASAATVVVGRVELDGAAIRLPDGFTALPAGWSDELDGIEAMPIREAKGFVRVSAAGDTVVLFRVFDVADGADGGKRPSLDRMSSTLEGIGRRPGGKIIRSKAKQGSRSIDVGVSFNRERNAGEWRGLSGYLDGAPTVRTWTVQCEDRPVTKSGDCEEIARSLAVPDLGTLRLFSDVYGSSE